MHNAGACLHLDSDAQCIAAISPGLFYGMNTLLKLQSVHNSEALWTQHGVCSYHFPGEEQAVTGYTEHVQRWMARQETGLLKGRFRSMTTTDVYSVYAECTRHRSARLDPWCTSVNRN